MRMDRIRSPFKWKSRILLFQFLKSKRMQETAFQIHEFGKSTALFFPFEKVEKI
jgi:hypothetical protein